MLIAGEASGDLLAAELVGALRTKIISGLVDWSSDVLPLRTTLAPRFFGAGGPHMKAAGVELAFDLTQHAVTGWSEVLRSFVTFRRLFRRLRRLAIERQPDIIIGVDYGGFNLRFGKAIKRYVRKHLSEFTPWNPKLVQFVSPQVWASRPGRTWTLADNYDLVLSIFPFEKDWYARRVPKLRVQFVGHPMVARMGGARSSVSQTPAAAGTIRDAVERDPTVLLLPGSRADEVRRHLPVVTGAFEIMRREIPGLRGKVVLPDDSLAEFVRPLRLAGDWELQPGNESAHLSAGMEIQIGYVASALAQADLAMTKSGTITMECAMFGVPAVVFYKTSWPTYFIAQRLVNVKYIAMPNLLANAELFPEFVQERATSENIAHAALELLRDQSRRTAIKRELEKVIASLGGPGAAERGAEAIASLLP